MSWRKNEIDRHEHVETLRTHILINENTPANESAQQVNVPKTRKTYCKGKACKKHTQHKVTQYKAGKVYIWGLTIGNSNSIRLRCSHKERDVTIESKVVMVVRPSLSSTRRQRRQRRLCWDWNVSTVKPSHNCLSSDASISSWVVIRRQRAPLWCSRWMLGFFSILQSCSTATTKTILIDWGVGQYAQIMHSIWFVLKKNDMIRWKVEPESSTLNFSCCISVSMLRWWEVLATNLWPWTHRFPYDQIRATFQHLHRSFLAKLFYIDQESIHC